MSRIGVAQRHRLHRHLRGDGGLQQIGVEGQRLVAQAGGAFGEHRHRVTRGQGIGHLVHDTQGVARFFAHDVQRAGRSHQAADHRPGLDIGLGHEARLRTHGMHGHDVQPGDMVGHDQLGAGAEAALHVKPYAEHGKQLLRPPGDAPLAAGGVQAREAQQHHRQAMQHVKHGAQQAHAGTAPHGKAVRRRGPRQDRIVRPGRAGKGVHGITQDRGAPPRRQAAAS